MPLTWLPNVSTDSCGICTSLNLIYLRPLEGAEELSQPKITCTHMQSVFKWRICTCISHCSSTSIPSKLFRFYFTPAVVWYWEWDEIALLFLNSGWWIINVCLHRPWVLDYHLGCYSPEEASCLCPGRSSRTPAILLSQPALIAEGMWVSRCYFFVYLNVCEYVSLEMMCICSVELQVLGSQTVLHFTVVSHHYPLLFYKEKFLKRRTNKHSQLETNLMMHNNFGNSLSFFKIGAK